MQLNKEQAGEQVRLSFPGCDIETVILWEGLYIFQIRRAEEGEEMWDPLVAVNPVTGDVKDFNPVLDGNQREISAALMKAKTGL